MGWNTSARTIRGVTYARGSWFTLNGTVPCYSSCDATTPKYWKTSEAATYYGYYSESYSKHPYCISTTRPGQADLYVDESAFPPATYYVSYNLNGGSGDFPAQAKVYGGSVNIHNRQPTRVGYTFKGWGTSATTTTPSYYTNSKYSGNASITLYAIWSANTYSIEYNANGGTGAPSKHTYTYSYTGAINLQSGKPTREGYTFLGWSLSATATEKTYDAGQYWYRSNPGNYVLYAVWAINTYRFTVYANGGELVSGTDVFSAIANYNAVVSVPVATRIGYTFAGWAVTGKGNLTQVGDAYRCTMGTSDVQLTAQWTVNEYAITFDANTNGGTPSKIIGYDYGDYVHTNEAAFYIPTKPYCEFVGWYTVPEDTEDKPVNLNTLVVRDNLTLYAHFEEKNTMLVSAEGSNRPAMAAVHTRGAYVEECEVMIYVDGAWRKAVVQT